MFKLRAKSSLFKAWLVYTHRRIFRAKRHFLKPGLFMHIGTYFTKIVDSWKTGLFIHYLHVLHALCAKRSLCKAWCACTCQQWHTHAHAHEHAQTFFSQSPAATEGRQTNTPLSKFNKPTLHIRVGAGGWGVDISVNPSLTFCKDARYCTLQVKTPVHNLQLRSNYIPAHQLTVLCCLVT